MKKVILLFIICISNLFAVAQTQRKKNNPQSSTADSATGVINKTNRQYKKQMVKDLNLTKIQKSKLKEIRHTGKQKKEAIENDATLTAAQRETKLKDLKRELAKNTMELLNDEQKAKMKQMRKEKNQQSIEEENN